MRLPLAALAATLLLASSMALAHSWYPWSCCSGNDCKPVPCDSITETPAGYDWEGLHYKRGQVEISKDSACHACAAGYLHNGVAGKSPRCLFILPGS